LFDFFDPPILFFDSHCNSLLLPEFSPVHFPRDCWCFPCFPVLIPELLFKIFTLSWKEWIRMLYRHYKGGVYELLHEATLESDLTPMVVYRAVANGTVWIRPRAVFHELVEIDGRRVPRFALQGKVGVVPDQVRAADCLKAGEKG
jgi:hypothetical protein